MAYLTVSEFRTRTTMPQADVDAVEVSEPGFIASKLEAMTSRINVQLRKRYAAPFASPVPEVVLDWLTTVTTPHVYLKRGVNPGDAQIDRIMALAEKAWTEITEAADAEKGLYDLPLRQDTTSTGATQGGPFSSSQASPYAWITEQRNRGWSDDGR